MVVGIFAPTEDIACEGSLFGIGLRVPRLCVDCVQTADHEVLAGQSLCGGMGGGVYVSVCHADLEEVVVGVEVPVGILNERKEGALR